MSTLVSIKNLSVEYSLGGGLFSSKEKVFKAVDDISFEIERGQVVGLVGESGSGKTTTGRAIIGLAPVSKGEICYEGQRIDNLTSKAFMPYRKKIQMIFQDPFSSLNPKMNILKTISEPLDIHFKSMNAKQKQDEVIRLLELVGLSGDVIDRFPHEFSGGQRQRIGIARALAVKPEFLICDEAVSALDVSVQASIINLLEDLAKELNLSMLFIAHDLAVVEHISDIILVMNKAKIVERGEAVELISNPKEEYTKSLIASIPTF